MEQIILNQTQVDQKCLRIAYQILETNMENAKIYLIGINGNGFLFAQKLSEVLKGICDKEILLGELTLNKKNPLEEASSSIELSDLKNNALILIDDVLQSGTTLMYGVRYFLSVPLANFKTAVLVDRNHKKYPVKADFKGLSLSTSNHSNVEVRFDYPNAQAILLQ
ncbi:MAG: phosphoribosyltransferase family protein [Flavobacteriaceae bacterium]